MNTSFQGDTDAQGGKDEWLTPPWVVRELGPFDLDPCSPLERPWDTALNHFDCIDDGLFLDWFGNVWCNPPYGREMAQWLKKASVHNNCMVLIFARTETRAFFDHVWCKASAVFFLKGRLRFHHVDGRQGSSAGAPSVLVAYGEEMAGRLEKCKISGKYIRL